ncbi:MAG: 3-carboxymuconate cyclase [Ignavibacteriae bacterium]|nr:MAG: 3-carboxymuconate cyclase [Ignavibacteriota bacterium]
MSSKLLVPILAVLTAGLIFLSSCKELGINPGVTSGPPDAVYTQTNQVAGNYVSWYQRGADGSLTLKNAYTTEGTGTGMELGSQGALSYNDNRSLLVAVNAGSNDVSVFKVTGNGLEFKSRTPSGGFMPISVTVKGNLVYVLNAGSSGNISGFKITDDGTLTAIPNSTRNLSNGGMGDAPGPAQISFNTSGTVIVVTEKMSNKIITYTVNSDGTVNGPNIFPSAGKTPFGFAFRNQNQIIVSEAFEGMTDSSAMSSYTVNQDGSITWISGPVRTTETAACWVVITNSGSYSYTSNTGSGTITGYSLDSRGELTILNSDGITANVGMNTMPIDMALSNDSKYLYSLNSGNHTISVFSVNNNGSLTAVNLNAITGVAVGTTGIVAK